MGKHERECLGGEADEHEKLDGFPNTACRLGLGRGDLEGPAAGLATRAAAGCSELESAGSGSRVAQRRGGRR